MHWPLSNLSNSFHVSSAIIGIAAMLIQIGYAIGLIFLVPLGDMVKHRALILTMLVCSMAALLELSFATNIVWFIVDVRVDGRLCARHRIPVHRGYRAFLRIQTEANLKRP